MPKHAAKPADADDLPAEPQATPTDDPRRILKQICEMVQGPVSAEVVTTTTDPSMSRVTASRSNSTGGRPSRSSSALRHFATSSTRSTIRTYSASLAASLE